MIRTITAILFGLLSLSAALFAVRVSQYAADAVPVINDPGPGSPTETLERFFTGLEEKDWDAAYGCLNNYSTLGLEKAPADPVSAMFWRAQQDAWEFRVLEGYEMSGTMVTKHATVRCVDYAALAAPIGGQVQSILAAEVENARLGSEVYDEDGNYKHDLVMEALEQVVRDRLGDISDYEYTKELTMRLTYVDGTWRINADTALLSALTGGAVR